MVLEKKNKVKKVEKIKKLKKGDEKIMLIWWVLYIGVVVVGIALGTFAFYGASIDANSVESKILYNNVMDCITKNGFLKDSVLKKEFENVYELCDLNQEFFKKGGDYYIEINLTNSTSDVIANFSSKIKNLRKECKMQKKIDAPKYPGCTVRNESVIYYKEEEVKKGTLNSIVVSHNKGEEVKTFNKDK